MGTNDSSFDARKSALVFTGFQVSALKSVVGADGMLDTLVEAVDLFRCHRGTDAYVRMAFTDADYQAVLAHSPMRSRLPHYGGTLDIDSPATAFPERIAPVPGDVIVRKTRVGAFSTTDLDAQLRARGITSVVLTGYATSGVVLTTVREAFDRDYQTYVLSDATADKAEDVHRLLLAVLFPKVATVIDLAGLAALFRDPV